MDVGTLQDLPLNIDEPPTLPAYDSVGETNTEGRLRGVLEVLAEVEILLKNNRISDAIDLCQNATEQYA